MKSSRWVNSTTPGRDLGDGEGVLAVEDPARPDLAEPAQLAAGLDDLHRRGKCGVAGGVVHDVGQRVPTRTVPLDRMMNGFQSG